MYPFKKGSFALKNAWYVAAFNHEVNRELLSRYIVNELIVLYRKENGDAVAVAGRCPHRHFPLGASKLVKDNIICGYHGIAFGPDGECTDIPTQDFVPQNCKIKSYPLVEHGLWLWIWVGDPNLADESLLPTLDEFGFKEGELGFNDPDMEFQAGPYIEVQGRYQLLNDNLLDLSHLAYLHGTSIGGIENATAEEIREEREGFLSSKRIMTKVDPQPMMTNFSGKIDRVSVMNSYLPGFHAGGEDAFINSEHPTRAGEQLIKGRVFHAVTPGLHDTTNYFFAAGLPKDEDVGLMIESLKSVLAEDIFATEEIEKILKNSGENLPQEVLLKSDAHAVRGRRMLQKMMDSEVKINN